MIALTDTIVLINKVIQLKSCRMEAVAGLRRTCSRAATTSVQPGIWPIAVLLLTAPVLFI